MICDTLVLSVSNKGSVFFNEGDEEAEVEVERQSPSLPSEHSRRAMLPGLLYARVALYIVELAIIVLCIVSVWEKQTVSHLSCPEQGGPLTFVRAITITLAVVQLIYGVGFIAWLDVCGCCTDRPKLIDLSFLEDKDEQRVGHFNFHRTNTYQNKIFKRLNVICCCLNQGGQRSSSLNDIASSLYVIFHDLDVVPSDILAGLILVKKDQRMKMGEEKCLVTGYKNVSILAVVSNN